MKSQQEQLALLQKKLAEETKSTDAATPQTNASSSGTISRVIAVEPAASGNPSPAQASSPSPTNATPPEEPTEVAAADSKGGEEAAPEPVKPTEAPLPQGATRQQLAQDMLIELSKLGCYFGSINGSWGARSRLALERFNRHARLELPLDEPQQASLDALKDWKGAHCPIEQAVPPRFKQRPAAVVPKTAPPRKAVRAAPPKAPPVQALRAPPHPQHHGGDEQRELQRAFPSTNWPGQ